MINYSSAQNGYVVNHCYPWIIWKYCSLYGFYWLQCTVTFNSNTELLNWIIKKLKSQTVCLVAEVILVHFAESSALELGCVQKAKLFPARLESFYITITEWPMENARTKDILLRVFRSISVSRSITEDHIKWFVVHFSRKEHKCR